MASEGTFLRLESSAVEQEQGTLYSHRADSDSEPIFLKQIAFSIAKIDVFDRKLHILAIDNFIYALNNHPSCDRKRALIF